MFVFFAIFLINFLLKGLCGCKVQPKYFNTDLFI